MLLKYVIKNHKSIILKQTNSKMIKITKVQYTETFSCWFHCYQRRKFETDWTGLFQALGNSAKYDCGKRRVGLKGLAVVREITQLDQV
jgi:hypothetical protein